MAASAYLVFGADDYLVTSKAKEIVGALVSPEEMAFSLEEVDGAVDTIDLALNAVDQCIEASRTVGFFRKGKVVWFRNVSFLSEAESRTGKSDVVKERVNRLAQLVKEGVPAGNTLIITAPAVDGRYALYKAFKSAGEVYEFAKSDKPHVSEKDAREWAAAVVSEAGLKMDHDAMQVFLDRVGVESRQIVNEVGKLLVYMGGRTQVRPEDVREVVSHSRTRRTWDLEDAVGRKDLACAIGLLRQLLFQKESAIAIVGSVGRRVRDLSLYREAIDRGWLVRAGGGQRTGVEWGRVAPEIEILLTEGLEKDPRQTNWYRAGLLADQARRFSRRELRRCRDAVMEASQQLVSGRMPDGMVLELMLVKMLKKDRTPAGA